MLKYIIKRIIGVIPTLIIVTTFVFFFVRLIPGDPARLVAGPQATLEDVEVVREELGLNKPIVPPHFSGGWRKKWYHDRRSSAPSIAWVEMLKQ